MLQIASQIPGCVCGVESFSPVFTYTQRPQGETVFSFTERNYLRQVLRCDACGHFVSRTDMDLSGMYSGEYVDATYGERMEATFRRIIALPDEKSDNTGRVKAVCEQAWAHFARSGAISLLDVGSGLCVFPHRMQAQGFDCTALDPDARAAEHARRIAGVKSVQADFVRMDGQAVSALGRFDMLTFNKVLEHVLDPVAMLRRAHALLAPEGMVYVELPDGEWAAQAGPGREEFFIEHHHVFSAASLAILAAKAGFRLMRLSRLIEPSTKYTLRSFLVPA